MILCGVMSGILGLFLLIRKKRLSDIVRKMLFVMLLMSILGFMIAVSESPVIEDGVKIKRNPAGDGDYQQELFLHADGLSGEYDYVIQIPEQLFTDNQEKAYLEAAKQEISEKFPGENKSVNLIRKKTIIQNSYQNGLVTAEWMFDNYEIMDTAGNVIAEQIPKNGVLIKAAVELRCGNSEELYEFYFRVFPEILDEEGKFFQALNDVLAGEAKMRGKEYLQLPHSVENRKITWTEKNEYLPEKIMLLGIVTACFLPVLEKNRKREKQKERERQLQLEYPELLSKLALLLGAGMTLAGAWKRIVYSYMEKRKNGKENDEKPVYEEMILTLRQIENGIGEERAYIQFAERCGLSSYKKLSRMLIANLKKGNGEMMEMLLLESENAFNERKSLARQYGEEAGTKLLLPMMLLLGVIMMILIVPAVLSFQL